MLQGPLSRDLWLRKRSLESCQVVQAGYGLFILTLRKSQQGGKHSAIKESPELIMPLASNHKSGTCAESFEEEMGTATESNKLS